MRKLTHEEIVSRQVKKAGLLRLPLCVVLNNVRSLHNVGTIFRTADGAGVGKIWLCGITGYPPQGGIAKTALGAQDHVPWEYREDVLGLLKELKAAGYQIVLLEQMQGSITHDEFKAKPPVCLVVGNEVEGISESLQMLTDAAIEIEMDGIKNSLNVAVAFGIAVYQLRSQLKTPPVVSGMQQSMLEKAFKMKLLIDKFLADRSRWEFLYLVIPFILWIFCFRHFFSGHVGLQQDAISYAQNINYYTDNLCKGVFPLWGDHDGSNGAPYHFFLRRIGDVNPFLFLIVLLKWLGVPSGMAYLAFLGMYFFLAGWAFYLIARTLFVDRFFAFCAYVLFLFSSWGAEIFYNYIIIIFVPIIWFFYFLLCFYRKPQRGHFLGMCLCVGLIVTTYIPFFFVTILALFSVLFTLFYWNVFIDFLKRSLAFFGKNKIFMVFCVIFLISSCVPELIFYKESKNGEFILPGRHLRSDTTSEMVVGLSAVASGDMINHGFIDHLFNDHKYLDMGDIYMPYIFFLILLTAAFARVDKLIFFLFFNILALSVISITSAAGVHRFLYDHIQFFKFIRNIYYFFWLAILPMGILLSVGAFRSLLTTIDRSSKKMFWLIFIIICHLIFVLFLCRQHGVLTGAWAAIFISMVYFLIYFRYKNKITYSLGFLTVLLAVFVQSVQVYGFLENRMNQIHLDTVQYEQTHALPKKDKLVMYYGPRWFGILVNYLDPAVLDNYRYHKFILYDNVVPYTDSPQFFKIFETTISSNTNIAYVSKFDTAPGDWSSIPVATPQPDLDPIASGKLSVINTDANTRRIKTRLSRSQFLVINENYHSDWHAFINGRPARLLRANVSFKGLWVPAGESNIVLRFSTPMGYMFHFGLLLLFAGTFIYFLVLLRYV